MKEVFNLFIAVIVITTILFITAVLELGMVNKKNNELREIIEKQSIELESYKDTGF